VPDDPGLAIVHLINIITHETGHQAGLGTAFDVKKRGPHNAPSGTVMAQPKTDAEMSENGVLEFWEEDAAILRQLYNKPPPE
jgi:hypothetical protein